MINSNTSPKQAMKTLMSLAVSLSLEQLENMASAPTQSLSISALDDFQAALNHENPEIRRVAKLAISLQILSLYGVNNKFIEQIIDCENNKTAKVFLNDEYFPEPTPKLFQAFCDVLRLSQMKQFVSEYDFSDLPEMCQSELLKAINDSSITTLGFNYFDVSTMSLSLFNEFLSLIEKHHFDELYFHLCNFYLLNPTQFQRFIQVLEFSKAKSLSLFDANYPGNNLPILCQLLTTENSSLIEFNTDIHSYWLNDLEYELWMSAIKNSKLRAMRLLPETADLMRFEIYCETIRNLEELDVSFDEWLNQLTPDQIKLFSDSTPNLRKLSIGSVDLFESNEQDKMIAWIDFFKKSKLIKIDFNHAELNGSEYDTEVLFDTLAELKLESLDVRRLQFNLTPSTFAAFCRLIKSISYKLTVTAEPVAESDKRFEGLCNAIADLQCRELDFE